MSLTLAEGKGPKETFEQVFGHNLFFQLEGRQNRGQLGVLNGQQSVVHDSLDH